MESSVNTLFAQIGLETYYPQKLTLKDALTLREETLDMAQCSDPKKWYLFVMQNVMAYHYQCRSVAKLPVKEGKKLRSDNPFLKMTEKSSSLKIHPVDNLLALIHCADDFLRQDLMSRLAKCQFAIPFILPDPHPGRKLTLPLWAMRSIVKEWKSTLSGSEGVQEGPIINFTIPVVAFVRFDKQQERSKSKIMNEVISDSYHDYFFHRDNKGGNFDRQLGEGLVEVCWYLPSGKPNDIFTEAVVFLNLHGDARKHSNQVSFLSQISFMNFALINSKDLDTNEKSTTKVLKQLAAAPGGIFMLASGESETFAEYYQKQNDISQDKLSGVYLGEQNVDDIKTTIRQAIMEKVKEKWNKRKQIKIANCIEIAHANHIDIDEDKEDLKQSCMLANKLQTILSDSASTKEHLLPLQGKRMWLEWSKQDKEEYRQINRGNKEVMEYSAQKMEEKKKIRQLQLDEVHNLNPLMKTFINTISDQKLEGRVRNYFLHSLKLWLDEHSRAKISKLRHDYNEQRIQLHQLQIKKKETGIKEAQEKASEIQDQLIEASFGLEHLLRELGQVYEAVQDSAHNPQSHQYSSLPSIAAELLIDGYSLELMDGDAAHVPIHWVSAVLKQLAKRLKDPRVSIVSVLGLQSTGKSTLLNTTFGLQFSVSAGRCTRGAFLQLLPVDEDLKKRLQCDFLMIVDTEGLRAPEQDSKKARKHDNELATFVTGIANATTINFGGETPGDMDDIMQTVVHAFIRMKTIKLNPSCQFVYQHVGEVAASDKGGLGHYNFKDNLDKMTREAAIEEESEGKYEFFNDVIQFDPEKDSHRFPDLWKGDPPMGSVNPGYCDKALALKRRLVEIAKSKSEKLSDAEIKIGMFWKALLHEKFVFSFRNTLETRVYSSLEKEYVQWALDFRNKMLKHERMARTRIKNAKIEALTDLETELLKTLPEYAHEIHGELEEKLVHFFEDDDDREMLAQWQAETQNRLKRLERELQEYAKNNAQELISSRKALADVKEEYKEYKEDIKRKVLELVAKLEKEGITKGVNDSEVDDKLKVIFDKEWENWTKEIERRASVRWEEINIIAVVENSLTDFFKIEEQRIIMKLKEKSLNEWGKELQLEVKSEHIRQSMRSEIDDNPNDLQETAKSKTEKTFSTVEKFLENLQNDYFDPSYTYQLLDTLTRSISEQTADDASVEFTLEYRIDMSLTACGYAVEHFRRMIETFRKENNPLLCLEREEKGTLFNIFKNHYLQVAKENAAACTLCDLLYNSIKKQISNSIGEIVFEAIKNQQWLHFQTKTALKARILVDLGEDLKQGSDLTGYYLFLEKAGKSLKMWIERYVKEYCQSEVNGQQQLVIIVNQKLKALIKNIEKAIDDMRKSNHEHRIRTQEWLDNFCSKLSTILVMDNFIGSKDLGGVQTLENIENFEKEVRNGLQKVSKDLQNEFKGLSVKVLDTCTNKPHIIFSDNLVGCTEQCPFCKEQCDCTLSGHSKNHQVEQHRPQGLGGYRYNRSRKMVLHLCSCEVGTDHKFQNRHTKGEWILYKEYHTIYPDWSIPVDMSAESSTYWKWFVATYSKEIAKHFDMLPNEGTSTWGNFTWEDAKKELQVAYKAWINDK